MHCFQLFQCGNVLLVDCFKMSEQRDQGNMQQLPGRGIKWQRIEDVPCAKNEAQYRHSTRDALFSKPVTKRQDGVTHGKIVFCPMASSYLPSEKSSIISSPATLEDVSFTSPFSGEAKSTSISSTLKRTVSDSEDCVVVDSDKVSSTHLYKSGTNKLVISTTIPKHISSACVSLKTLVQVMLEYNGHKRGLDTMWRHMGVETNMGHCLYPEEALFLMQASDFRALCPNNRVLSVEHALALTNTPYAMFRVYSKLCGASLKPVRHQPHVGITSYEKKIKLDQHNIFKKKKTTVPGIDQISSRNIPTSPSINNVNNSAPPCNSNAPNTAKISNVVSTAKSFDSKDDIDLEMMAFYNCIEEETKEVEDTPVYDTTKPKDEMEDVVEEKEEIVVTDDMVKAYERSKQLILRDLPCMNPRTGEYRITEAASFLPSSLKVLTEDYVVLNEDINQFSKKAMRAIGNWKQNMSNLANSARRINPEPTIGSEPIDHDSDSSEILDSDTETSSSSDSESVSSLSDSEDVCYQGWYTNWNNIIYMKRIMAASDDLTYDATKRDLDEPDDRNDKCVKHARCGASPLRPPSYVALLHDQGLKQHQGKEETPCAQMPSLIQGFQTGLPAVPVDDSNSGAFITSEIPCSSSIHNLHVVPDPDVLRTENENMVRGDLTMSETGSSSTTTTTTTTTSSSSSSGSSSSDSEDSSSVEVDIKMEKHSSPEHDKPEGTHAEESSVGNAIDQTDDDPNKMVESNAVNESPKKVSWENPVSDFLDILGQTLKSNDFKNTSEESPEKTLLLKEEPAKWAVVDGRHDCVQDEDSSTVNSVINLIHSVRKGTEIIDNSFSNSAKFMKRERGDVHVIEQYKHDRLSSTKNTGGVVAGALCLPSHASASYQNSLASSGKRPIDDDASVIKSDINDDLRMSLPERGHSRDSLATSPRRGRGSLQVTVSNRGRSCGKGQNLAASIATAVRSVHSAPNGELRVSLGCASTSTDSSFNTRKKANQQTSIVKSSELTSDCALLERLGEQYSPSEQREGEARDTWRPPFDFDFPSQAYNCGISVPNSTMRRKPDNLGRELTDAGDGSDDFNSEVSENSHSSKAMDIDANYHGMLSPNRGNFRGRISHTGFHGQNNKRGLRSPRGQHRGNSRANYNLCDSFDKGGYLGSFGTTEVKRSEERDDSQHIPNFETARGSYSGNQGAPPQVAHSKEMDDRETSSVPEKKSYPFPPPCFGNTFPENQRRDNSRSFTNQNTNHWRGNQDERWRPNQQGPNTQGDLTNSWQSSNRGHSLNLYSSRGQRQINGMQRDSWRAPSDCGRGSAPREGEDGSWMKVGRGFKNDSGGSSLTSIAESLDYNRKGGDNFSRGRGEDNFSRRRGEDNVSRGRGEDSFSRGRGEDNFSRGRGGDNFSSGRGGDNFSRGRGDNFSRGRGDNFSRGSGGDNFSRGRGGDNFPRGSGGDGYNKGRREGPSNDSRGRPNNSSSGNKRERGQDRPGRGRGNARQQARQGRWNYWQTFKAQKSMLDESIVHNVCSWHEYKSAVREKEVERQQRRPSMAALLAGVVKPIITPGERHGLTLDGVLAKVRGECSSSTSSSSCGGDLSEWLQQEVPEAAALYMPSQLPQVAFDVYSCKSNYSRSNPTIPEFRVVLSGEETDENLSACRVLALRRHHADSADLALATNAQSTGRVRHVAFPAAPSSDGRLRPHALTWSKKLDERR